MTFQIKVIHLENDTPPTEEEAEARLRQEGYEPFRWTDVPGAQYPRHRHAYDECIWILKGEIVFNVEGKDYPLKAGDRIYLPERTPHTAIVPNIRMVTFLVGQKTKPQN